MSNNLIHIVSPQSIGLTFLSKVVICWYIYSKITHIVRHI